MIDIRALSSGSRGNCYRIDDGSSPILLECGMSYKEIQRWLNFKVSNLAGCLVSHEHQDHAKAVKDMLKAGVNCYMSEGTAKALSIKNHRISLVKSKKQLSIGSWTVLPFNAEHDAEEPLGFLLANQEGEKLIYATDTYYVRYKFSGLTHIMVEANYCPSIVKENVANGSLDKVVAKRLWSSHFSLPNVKEFLKANDLIKVQEIWLLHLSDDNSDAERFAKEIRALTGKPVYVAG